MPTRFRAKFISTMKGETLKVTVNYHLPVAHRFIIEIYRIDRLDSSSRSNSTVQVQRKRIRNGFRSKVSIRRVNQRRVIPRKTKSTSRPCKISSSSRSPSISSPTWFYAFSTRITLRASSPSNIRLSSRIHETLSFSVKFSTPVDEFEERRKGKRKERRGERTDRRDYRAADGSSFSRRRGGGGGGESVRAFVRNELPSQRAASFQVR